MAILFFLGSRGVNAADPQNSNIEQDLIKLEDQCNQATENGDFAFMDSVIADDYICTTADNTVWDKAQSIAYQKARPHNFTIINDDYRVKVYGNTAVVTFHEDFKDPGARIQCRETDVWVKKGSQWQCVATHESKING